VPLRDDPAYERRELAATQEVAREEERGSRPPARELVEDDLASFRVLVAGELEGDLPRV